MGCEFQIVVNRLKHLSLLIKTGTITINTFLPTRNVYLFTSTWESNFHSSFLKNSVTNKKLLIHSSFAHKIHSFYSQYELFLNNKNQSYNGQSSGLAIWQCFFKMENPHFERQSIFIKELYIKSALSLHPWRLSAALQYDL